MSFEGYYRILCKNGHLDTRDRYAYGYDYAAEGSDCWKCSKCGADEGWRQLIDETNGSGKDQEYPLTILKEAIYERCSLGYDHLIKMTVYKIPSKSEFKVFLGTQQEDGSND